MSKRSSRSTSKSSTTNQEEEELPLELTESEISQILSSSQITKPSTLSNNNKSNKPLIILSPEELNDLVEKERKDGGLIGDEEEEEEPVELWEELLTDLFWSIPFGFLEYGMDTAVHAQFGMDLIFNQAMSRLFTIVSTIFIFTFILSRPTSSQILPPLAIQVLLLALCLSSGITLIHITTTESYLKVMKQAPGLGTLWCWSMVRLDLIWSIIGLLGVALAVYLRGEAGGVIWW